MKTGINLPQELMTGIDVVNTLNGGMSEPVVKLKQFSSYREITIRIPGVDIVNIKIEINNNELMIYYFMVLLSQEKEMKLPKVLYNKSLPYFVDANHITASRKEDSLVVRLPFNELANGNHRDISISL